MFSFNWRVVHLKCGGLRLLCLSFVSLRINEEDDFWHCVMVVFVTSCFLIYIYTIGFNAKQRTKEINLF